MQSLLGKSKEERVKMSEYPTNAEYNKLVRDKIPEIIESQGLAAETKKLSDAEIEEFLKQKLLEESKELLSAEEIEEIKKEMADILEVLYSLAARKGISPDEIEKIRKDRAEKRGGFKDGIFLIRTKAK